MSRKISDVLQGHDNNYAFIRLMCAYLVVFQHAIFLANADYKLHDLFSFMDIELSAVAVQVFFVISGFLVTGSLLTRGCLNDFIWSRVLRIMPALLLVLLLSVFIIGPLVSTSEISEYLGDTQTYRYLMQNSVLVFGAYYELPGVFEANPYASVVNGSLWTLPHEVRLYLMLALFWMITSIGSVKKLGIRFHHLLLLIAIACLASIVADPEAVNVHSNKSVLIFLFAVGGLMRFYSDRVPLYWPLALGLVVILLVLGIAELESSFYVLYVLAIPYLLIFLAYYPSRFMGWFNRLGDYSYGIYIYSFAIQQLLVHLFTGIDEWSLLLWSTLASFAVAMLSWHLLEKRALSYRKAIVALSKRFTQVSGS